MLYKKKDNKMIILGINELSLAFARKYSNSYDIVMIKEDETTEKTEVDVIITPIVNDILDTLLKNELDNAFFLALTENEEFNLFTACLAHEYGARETIALVSNPNYMNLSSASYIVNPYQIIIDKIESLIKETRLRNIISLIPGKVKVIKFILNKKDHFAYKKVKDIKINDGLIFAVKRKEKMIIATDDIELIPDDSLYILFKRGMLSVIFNQIFKKVKIRNKVFILGGNELGYLQAVSLKNIFNSVILIEPDINNCHKLARKSEDIIILHGEGTEKKMLLEEGLTNNSILLALDNDDYHNLLSSYQAKTLGCNNIITLLNYNKHVEIAELLGLNNIISLPQVVTDHLYNYIKIGHKINKLFLGSDVYTAKIRIKPDSKVVNKKINELKYKFIFLIGVIIRGNKIIIPDRSEYIFQGDEVLLFFYKNMETRIYNIFN